MKPLLCLTIIVFAVMLAIGQRNAFQEVERGHELKKAGNEAAAIEAYSRAINIDPNFLSAYIGRGEILAKAKKWAEALPDFTKALEIQPQNYAALVGRAYSLAGIGNLHECIAAATKAVDVNPSNPEAYNRRGYCYCTDGNLQNALRDFDQAIQLGMTTAEAYYRRAGAREATDDWFGAIVDYTRAIELDPNDWKKYQARATARRSYGDYLGSIEDYNKVLEIDPKDRVQIFSRSWSKLFSSDHAGAYQDTLEYLGEEGAASENAPLPIMVGFIALRKMDKPEAAVALVRDALKVKRSEPHTNFLRFLVGETAPEKLLELVKNDEMLLTVAHALIGTKCLLDGDRRSATIHFEWDQKHGSHGTVFHQLARTEYARMNGDTRLLKPPLPSKKP